jgi:vitamin B12 transporter
MLILSKLLKKRGEMKKLIYLSIVICSIVLAQVSIAEEITIMDEVVVTATRTEEKTKNIPAKIEVIDKNQIELTAGETLTEQLKKNASIDVIEYGTDLSGIGIRGFGPELPKITMHSLVLIDSRPAGATNLSSILSDNIERIEILKGPASSLYGGEAMGGVVNIITKKHTGELTGLVEVGTGSFATNFQKAAIGGGITDRIDFDIYARQYDQRDDFQMGSGDSRANTSFKTRNGDVRLGMTLGETWRFDIGADGYQGIDVELPGDIFNGDVQSGKKDMDRWAVDTTLSGMVGNSNNFSFTAYNTMESRENYQDYTGWGPYTTAPTHKTEEAETTWIGFQVKDSVNWNSHKIILGMDYQIVEAISRRYDTTGARLAPWSPDESRENIAGYIETIWNFFDKRLTATLGGRYDFFDVSTEPTPYLTSFTPRTESFDTFSPRTGLNYLFDKGLRLHTTIGKAFVPPTSAQLAANITSWGTTTTGNPNLEPESSITWDAGVGYERPQTGFKIDITYFHTDVDDKIITEDTSLTTKTYRNSLGGEIHGMEYMFSFDIGAPLRWDRSLSFFVNGTKIFNAEEEKTDHSMQDIRNVASHIINYGISYDDGLIEAKLHARYQGPVKDQDWHTTGYPEIEYPSFTVVDLSTGINFMDHHKILVNIDNLLDHSYYEKKGFPKPGISLFVSYRYSF